MEEICNGRCNVHPGCAGSDCSAGLFSTHAGVFIILSSQVIAFQFPLFIHGKMQPITLTVTSNHSEIQVCDMVSGPKNGN